MILFLLSSNRRISLYQIITNDEMNGSYTKIIKKSSINFDRTHDIHYKAQYLCLRFRS